MKQDGISLDFSLTGLNDSSKLLMARQTINQSNRCAYSCSYVYFEGFDNGVSDEYGNYSGFIGALQRHVSYRSFEVFCCEISSFTLGCRHLVVRGSV